MRGTRLDPDWRPNPSLKAWAQYRRPDLDIDELVDEFLDYWCAVSGQKGLKLDWDRTFRNCVRNARGSPVLNAKPTSVRPTIKPCAPRVDTQERQNRVSRFGEFLGKMFPKVQP